MTPTPASPGPQYPSNGRIDDLTYQSRQHDRRISTVESSLARMEVIVGTIAEDVRALREEERPDATRGRTALALQWTTIILLVATLGVRLAEPILVALIHR